MRSFDDNNLDDFDSQERELELFEDLLDLLLRKPDDVAMILVIHDWTF